MNILLDDKIAIPEEQLRIRAKCFHPSGSFEEFKKEDIEQSIPGRFENQASRYPDRLAIKTNNFELNYNMLNCEANRIAHAILELRKQGPEPILLLFEHDAPAIVSMLGTLKAGKFYIPVAPDSPPERISEIVNDSQSRLLLTNSKNIGLARSLLKDKIQLYNIDEIGTRLSVENPIIPLLPDAFSYILYTSGSTGRPKGVIENHLDVLRFTRLCTNRYRICCEDRLTLLNPLVFSGSVTTIFPALLNGAALFPFDLKSEDFSTLAEWMNKEEITIYESVPVVFRQMITFLTEEFRFPKIRVINLGGDRVIESDIEAYKKYFSPNCIMRCGLGASEVKTFTEYWIDKDTTINNSKVPAGYAAEGIEILLLDDNGQEVGLNQIGEIVVKSRYLSPGYWRRPELTKAKFLPDSESGDKRFYHTGDLGRMKDNGCLFHLGRKDYQIKIRGHLVEPAEIENTLLNLDSVKETVVKASKTKTGEQMLVAYVVCGGHRLRNVSGLRRVLSEKLPEYMIPSRFVILDALPLNPNGKVDRKALPEPDNLRPDLDNPLVPPQTAVERTLVKIWSEILNIQPVGIHDKFLELGGNSLLATRIISRVLNTFQVKLSLQSLLAAPTIAEMDVLITQNQAKKVDQEELDIMLAELEKLTDKEAKEITKLM